MEYILYVILYVAFLGMFISFGRFLKQCDETMVEQIKFKSTKEV